MDLGWPIILKQVPMIHWNIGSHTTSKRRHFGRSPCRGNDWALSFVNRTGSESFVLHSTLALGNNGDQTNHNRDGDLVVLF